MSVRRAVLISVAAHAVVGSLIVWRATIEDASLLIGEPVTGVAVDVVAADVPREVEVLDVLEVAVLPPDPVAVGVAPPQAAAAPIAAAHSASHGSATGAAIAVEEPGGTAMTTATIRTTSAPDATTGVGDGKASKYMTMRGPDLALPNDVAERVIASSRPPPVGPDESRLVHRGGNIYIPDLQVPAKVNDDGTVTFHDKPAADIHWRLHLPSAQDLGDALAVWYADPYAAQRARPWQELNKVDQAVDGDGAGWDSGGSTEDGRPAATFNKPGYSTAGQPQIPIVGGALDLTSWAMRKFKVGDPYASRKRKLLAETFDARAAIGAANAEARLARSIALMQRNVVRVWTAPNLAPAARRAALFALWDECAEGDPATSHEAEAGTKARLIVIAFIHTHAGAHTPDAFTTAELAALDAGRTSKQHFTPYDPDPK